MTASVLSASVLPVAAETKLHNLAHADGSAGLKLGDFEVLATVNGPLEAQRRDELPDEAFVEVHVRPTSGSGSPRDRHIEQILARTLRAVILTTALPRTLIQVTLQLVATPGTRTSATPPSQSESVLPSLPPLINAAVLALLDANIAMRQVVAAVLVTSKNDAGDDSSADQDDDGEAQHVFAIDTAGNLLLCESEGSFSLAQWQAASAHAVEQVKDVHASLRTLVGSSVQERLKWRDDGP